MSVLLALTSPSHTVYEFRIALQDIHGFIGESHPIYGRLEAVLRGAKGDIWSGANQTGASTCVGDDDTNTGEVLDDHRSDERDQHRALIREDSRPLP